MAPIPASLDPDILERNLAALRQADPVLAEQVDAARSHAPQVVPALTRDGQVNLHLQRADGNSDWFGRTSIPLTRATALIDQFEAGTGNVLLPDIAEGSEAMLLLRRLARHRAVFIWERDAVNLLLAMQLHDYAAAIADGRLVCMLCPLDELKNTLVAALQARPGHLCPERILMWPWCAWAAIAECRSAVENAFRSIERERKGQLATAQTRLTALPAAEQPLPTAVLMAVHSVNELTAAWSDRLSSAALSAGWRLVSAVVRTPGDVHALARTTYLADALDRRPDFAVLLDLCRTDVQGVLPPNVPAVSWLSHQVNSNELAARIGPTDATIATDSIVARRLVESGVASSRVTIQPQPCLVADGSTSVADFADRPFDVVILANLGSTDAASYGHDLPTHSRIWAATVDLIKLDLDGFHDDQIDAILHRAESKLGMRIEDAKTRREIADLLAGPVASSLICRELAQALVLSKVNIACWGLGWSGMAGVASQGAVPGLAARAELYRQAKCAIFVSPVGVVSPDTLIAAQAGAAVLWRSHPRDVQAGGMSKLLSAGREYLGFRRFREISGEIRRLLGNPEQWRRLTEEARQHCLQAHSAAAALARLQAVASSFVAHRSA